MPNSIKGLDRIAYHFRMLRRKYIRGWWIDHKWQIIGLLAITSIALGCIGFRELYIEQKQKYTILHLIYVSMQLFIMDSNSILPPFPWMLTVARFLAPFVAWYTAIQALAIIFREQFQFFRVKFFKDHIIICGLGEKGMMLAGRFQEQGYQVLAIEHDAGNDNVKQCQEQGIITLVGDATEPEMLNKARIKNAQYLILVCNNDGTNAEIAVQARKLVASRTGKPLTCIIHLILPQLCHLLRELEIHSSQSSPFQIEFFNVFDSGARALLEEYTNNNQNNESEKDDEMQTKSLNMVVVGVGRMGESLILHALKKWCVNYICNGERLHITMIDRDAQMKYNLLIKQYPIIKKACELVPIQMDVSSAEFQQADFIAQSDQNKKSIVFVCFDNESFGLYTALTLLHRLKNSEKEISIVVRMIRDTWANFLTKEDAKNFDCLNVFGLLDRTLKPELVLGGMHETLARSIHKDYIRRQKGLGYNVETNPSMVSWGELSEEFKDLNRSRANRIENQLESIGYYVGPFSDLNIEGFKFADDEIELLAQMEHRQYVEERLKRGFKYGEVKDNKRKINPNLVPWDSLSEDVKRQNREEFERLPIILAQVDLQIYHK